MPNLVIACMRCNAQKHDKLVSEWRPSVAQETEQQAIDLDVGVLARP